MLLVRNGAGKTTRSRAIGLQRVLSVLAMPFKNKKRGSKKPKMQKKKKSVCLTNRIVRVRNSLCRIVFKNNLWEQFLGRTQKQNLRTICSPWKYCTFMFNVKVPKIFFLFQLLFRALQKFTNGIWWAFTLGITNNFWEMTKVYPTTNILMWYTSQKKGGEKALKLIKQFFFPTMMRP